jgi:hypothetical protein
MAMRLSSLDQISFAWLDHGTIKDRMSVRVSASPITPLKEIKMFFDHLWLFATAGGAFILGCAIAYAMLKSQRLSADEQARQDRKVRELYDKDA